MMGRAMGRKRASTGGGSFLRGSARCARALARTVVCCGLVAAAGCGEAAADVVALWVDSVSDDDGNRPVRLYEAGERDVFSVVPDIPGSSIDLLQVGVDARARGIAVSATDATVWVERGSGRRVTMNAAAVGRSELVATEFAFTRSGDGILRALAVDASLPPAWLFAPLSGPDGLRVHTVGPPTVAGPARRWALHHATDAPVMVLAEIDDGEISVSGQVLALAYPSEEGQGPVVDDLRPLARGVLEGPPYASPGSRYLSGCRDRLCLSPSGRAVYTRTPDPSCDLWRWSWVEALSSDVDTPPERVSIECPAGAETQLAAVLDDDLLVLDDALRLYLVDLGAGSVVGLPKPGGLLSPHLADRGRVLLVASNHGEVARVDAHGPRMISGVQSGCSQTEGMAVSPGGAWLVQSCLLGGIGGQIQRISVLGSEIYAGVPMRPIAVDDDGNALLYSVGPSDDDGVPHGLFVLSGDGQLTRVDELEPAPGEVLLTKLDGESSPGRFAAGGPS